jgi:hypothetical protein
MLLRHSLGWPLERLCDGWRSLVASLPNPG